MRDLKTDRRVAVHEAAHCVAARALCMTVTAVTIDPDPAGNFEGRVFGGDNTSQLDSVMIAAEAARMMPGHGETRTNAAEWLVHATNRAIELAAGVEGELLAFPSEPTFIARQDAVDAQAYAGSLCRSAGAVDAFLAYAHREAAELLSEHKTALHALTDALLTHRTMSGAAVDQILVEALTAADAEAERQRRADWAAAIENARSFQKEKAENGP